MKMERFLLIMLCTFCVGISMAAAQNAQVRKCTPQDLPMDARDAYMENVKRLVQTYYDQLLLNVGEPMVQESFTESYMVTDAQRYMPEFVQNTSNLQFLTPVQYMQELEKTFNNVDIDELEWGVENLYMDKEDFYMLNLMSCYAVVQYDLSLRQGEEILFTRKCEAYCLFPRASVSIKVKMMQISPLTQGTFKVDKLARASERVPSDKHDVKVTADMLPDTQNKIRVVSHHPDLTVEVQKVSIDQQGYWIDATITNLSENDEKVNINTNLRAYDDEGNIYEEHGRNRDMRMYVGNSKNPTNWNGQQQAIVLPSEVPIKVRILLMGMPKKAKGIRRLDWGLYSDGLSIHPQSITIQLFDVYQNPADRAAAVALMPQKQANDFPKVRESVPGLEMQISNIRKAGETFVMNLYVCNRTRKDGSLAIHSGIKAFDDLGNVYEGKGSGGQIQLYIGKDKLPANWDAQSTKVVLPPDIPVKLRLQIKGLDPSATSFSRILWHTISESFGTRYNTPTFTVSQVPIV